MASEILAVPEEILPEVVGIIKLIAGTLNHGAFQPGGKGDRAVKLLLDWCKEEEEYMKRITQ